VPNVWREKCKELRDLGDVSMAQYLEETGLDLEDIYAANHSWTEMRRAVGLATLPPGPDEELLLRAVGRLLHVDDEERIAAYRSFVIDGHPPNPVELEERPRRLLRMLVASLTSLGTSSPLEEGVRQIWNAPQVCAEVAELLDLLLGRISHLSRVLSLDSAIPIRAHARYTRLEILAGFGVGSGARPLNWQSGVYYVADAKADLFAFTLDKSIGGFSPTTRYRDYAISPGLIHWESQSVTSTASETGQRYIDHEARGSNVVLFARLRADQRALWCLGTARYRSHEGERPIAFVWELDMPLPAELYTAFAAAVA
jgi:hypothetical protein